MDPLAEPVLNLKESAILNRRECSLLNKDLQLADRVLQVLRTLFSTARTNVYPSYFFPNGSAPGVERTALPRRASSCFWAAQEQQHGNSVRRAERMRSALHCIGPQGAVASSAARHRLAVG